MSPLIAFDFFTPWNAPLPLERPSQLGPAWGTKELGESKGNFLTWDYEDDKDESDINGTRPNDDQPQAFTNDSIMSPDINMVQKKGRGRPPKVKPAHLHSEVVKVLDLARQNGSEMTIEQACLQLGISIRTYQRAVKKFGRQ